MSVKEAVRLLGIGRTMAYGLVAKGGIPSVKLGRRRLVPREAIQAFIDAVVKGAEA